MSGAKASSQSSRGKKTGEVISEHLHGLNICASGFSPIENKLIKSKIEKLGGTFNENLLASTHYLIVNKINTDKAITAVKYNITLVTKEWLNEKNSEKYLDQEKCKPSCFYGINLFLFGFNEEEKNLMKIIIKEKNGETINSAEDADIIIVKSNSGYIDEEIEKLKKYHNKTVSEEWYNSCLERNEYKPIDDKKDLLNLKMIKPFSYKRIVTFFLEIK